MAQRYEYQDIDGHIILLFVHPAEKYRNTKDLKHSKALKVLKTNLRFGLKIPILLLALTIESPHSC